MKEHSRTVESDLLAKLHALSDSYKSLMQERDQLALKCKDTQSEWRRVEVFAEAVEKENAYLRLEVERVKYSKDKEGYSKFLGGLIPQPKGGHPLKEIKMTSSSSGDRGGENNISERKEEDEQKQKGMMLQKQGSNIAVEGTSEDKENETVVAEEQHSKDQMKA